MTQVNPKHHLGTSGDLRNSFVGNQKSEEEAWLRAFVNSQVQEK